MKKLLVVLVLLLVFIPSARAEQAIDLSAMSYDELVALKLQVDAEVMSRPETKEVTVPKGVYTVGLHIPAGEYTVEAGGSGIVFYVYGNESMSTSSLIEGYYIGTDSPLGRVILKDGNVVSLDDPAIFKPFIGLGF